MYVHTASSPNNKTSLDAAIDAFDRQPTALAHILTSNLHFVGDQRVIVFFWESGLELNVWKSCATDARSTRRTPFWNSPVIYWDRLLFVEKLPHSKIMFRTKIRKILPYINKKFFLREKTGMCNV